MAGQAHGAEGGASFPPFDVALFPHQIFWFAVSFGVLYWLVASVIIPRIRGVIDARAAAVKADLDAAARESEAAEAARKAAEKAGADARAEGRTLIEAVNAKVRADITAETARVDAEEAGKAAAAEARIQAMRAEALGSLDDLAADLAVAISKKVAGVTVTAKTARAAVKAGAA